jgi:hypothetical protein
MAGMQIAVMSDSHDRLPALRAAVAEARRRGLRTLLHLGDIIAPFAAKLLAEFEGALHVIYGNNDGERAGLKKTLPQIQDGPLHLTLADRRILMHHFIDWCRPEDIAAADVVCTGHTHQWGVETREGRLFINPGEVCGWLTGRCTFAVLDLNTLDVERVELPE